MPYELCTTSASVSNALVYLRTSAHLFVDLEGRDLGCDIGALSVISVGTVMAHKIFIFDVLTLSREELQPVLDVLADAWRLKIVWDGRMDDVELRRTFNISFGRVLDLQIADIVSRPERGADDRYRMDRVWHPLNPVRHLDTDDVYASTALKNALVAHGVYENSRDESRTMDHSEWMTRPLQSAYLEYAAKDIQLIARVYTIFQGRGHVTNRRRDRSELETQSLRYVRMHAAPVQNNNAFYCSNLLPLEILAPPTANTGAAKECVKCGRSLCPASFTYFLGPRSKVHVTTTHDTCKVCYLLVERAVVKEQESSSSRLPSNSGLPSNGGLAVIATALASLSIGRTPKSRYFDDLDDDDDAFDIDSDECDLYYTHDHDRFHSDYSD